MFREEAGSSLLTTLVLITVMTVLIGAVLALQSAQYRFIRRDAHRQQARYAAEAGIYVALDSLQQRPYWHPNKVRIPLPDGQESRRKRQKTVEVVRPEAVPKGDDAAVEREQPVDVPRIRFGRADDFERPWHLALWAPNDPDGPTVILNLDSPILQEAVEHHQEQYPDVYAEEIAKVVRQVFGEVAACKVAHAQKLTRQIPEQELDRDYRNEAALTVALMGLIAEESLLGHRLKQFGRKKGVA